MTAPCRRVDVVKVDGGMARAHVDVAATEEPLEIRVAGEPFVTIMRTPGHDRELAAGFLLAERLIAGADDLGAIRHCLDPDGVASPNVVDVTLAGDAAVGAERLLSRRRLIMANSSCGVCGRRTIDDLMTDIAPLPYAWSVRGAVIAAMGSALRRAQPVFDETGGLHAAALFDREGRLVSSAEDVGRHNAVDKVIGRELLLERVPLDDRLLFVSGRASYEIVQKALVARIPLLASVSAPSTLAIDLARQAGLTLLGFVRGDTFNVYSGEHRLEPAAANHPSPITNS